MLGQKRTELDNLVACDKFESTILEGQLCYSLDMAKLGGKTAKSGKENGLFLLLDPNPYQLNVTTNNVESSRTGDESFKVFIHTLSQFSTFEPGTYGMSTLKKMTGTESFEQLPEQQKKCLVHNREKCQTLKFLDHVQTQCNCSSWALKANSGKIQV